MPSVLHAKVARGNSGCGNGAEGLLLFSTFLAVATTEKKTKQSFSRERVFLFFSLLTHASPSSFVSRGVSAQSALTKRRNQVTRAHRELEVSKSSQGKHSEKRTHLPSVDVDLGKRAAAAADFLLLVDGGDAFAAAATPRPEHDATGAESACMGGRGIYERRRWRQARREFTRETRARREGSAFGFAKQGKSKQRFVFSSSKNCE